MHEASCLNIRARKTIDAYIERHFAIRQEMQRAQYPGMEM